MGEGLCSKKGVCKGKKLMEKEEMKETKKKSDGV